METPEVNICPTCGQDQAKLRAMEDAVRAVNNVQLAPALERIVELEAEVERLQAIIRDNDHYVMSIKQESAEAKALAERYRAALEVYAMTNETFPEYGDVARQALAERGDG